MMEMGTFKERVAALREIDAAFSRFGAYMHQYRLGPSLSEAELAAFETRYGIRLPEDLRVFLERVGNGGAGPGYGLNRLGLLAIPPKEKGQSTFPVIVYRGTKTEYPIEYYRTRFPQCYFDTLKQLTAEPSVLRQRSPLKEAVTEPSDDEWAEYLHGALTLADYGCGLTARLLLSGCAEGTVWVFDDCDRAAITPFADFAPTLGGPDLGNKEVSFSQWYDHWLTSEGV